MCAPAYFFDASREEILSNIELTKPTDTDGFWLQPYNSPINNDVIRTMERHAQVAAAFVLDAPGCEDAAIEIVLYAQSQIEFLNGFSVNGSARDNYLSAKNLVELRLECAADLLELKRLSDLVVAKAPESRLAREIAWGPSHSMAMLRAIDHVLEEAGQ